LSQNEQQAFEITGINTYEDAQRGVRVEVLGRTGIRYSDLDATLEIEYEVSATPKSIAVYTNNIQRWDDGSAIDDADRQRVIVDVVRAVEECVNGRVVLI
jgi:hypothetical protein